MAFYSNNHPLEISQDDVRAAATALRESGALRDGLDDKAAHEVAIGILRAVRKVAAEARDKFTSPAGRSSPSR